MAFVRWQPWQEIDALRRQFDQLFDDIAPSNRTALLSTRNLWQPAIELKNTVELRPSDQRIRQATAMSSTMSTSHSRPWTIPT